MRKLMEPCLGFEFGSSAREKRSREARGRVGFAFAASRGSGGVDFGRLATDARGAHRGCRPRTPGRQRRRARKFLVIAKNEKSMRKLPRQAFSFQVNTKRIHGFSEVPPCSALRQRNGTFKPRFRPRRRCAGERDPEAAASSLPPTR